MRKGDEKRQELLNVADRLFCTRGYDATSVQDILDVLHTSKGGFYHYFASKESVLDTLCGQRAERFASEAQKAMDGEEDTVRRLNILLHHFLPMRLEEGGFIRMLLPLLDKPEGMAVRARYEDALMTAFLPLLTQEIAQGVQRDACHPVSHEMGVPVLVLANACWVEAARLVLDSARQGSRMDPAAALTVLEKYRRAIEVLLEAPYGSIELLPLGEWAALSEQLAYHLAMPMNP